MKKKSNKYKNPKDGVLQRGYPHREHNKNNKKGNTLSRLLKKLKAVKDNEKLKDNEI